jgi:hypothetical protein
MPETLFSTRSRPIAPAISTYFSVRTVAIGLLAILTTAPIRAAAPPQPAPVPVSAPTYADLADFAESAPLVLRVQVRKQAAVEPARAGSVAPGRARLYIEARALELLVGTHPVGEDLSYLADGMLDAKGKPEALKKAMLIAFARPVPGRPAEIQLVAPDAQVPWTPPIDARLRAILAELRAPDAPGRVTGVRDAMFVPGTLAGEGETQISLATARGVPAAISVVHQPGHPPAWNASFGEVFDMSGKAPARDTLAWYRLACFLPRTLPAIANLSGGEVERAQAAADYRLVIEQLGPCQRAHL